MENKFCPQCGAPLEADAKFCTECGAKLSPAEETVTQAAPAVPPVTQTPVQLAQPAYPQPAQPAYQQPAQPAYPQPAQPAYPQPAQPAYQQPAQPAYQQPAQPAYQQPAQPAYQQPAQPAYPQPAQPAYPQPGYGQPQYTPYPAANPYGYTPPAPKKKGGKVAAIIIVVVVLLAAAGGAVWYFLLGGGGLSKRNLARGEWTAQMDVANVSEEELIDLMADSGGDREIMKTLIRLQGTDPFKDSANQLVSAISITFAEDDTCSVKIDAKKLRSGMFAMMRMMFKAMGEMSTEDALKLFGGSGEISAEDMEQYLGMMGFDSWAEYVEALSEQTIGKMEEEYTEEEILQNFGADEGTRIENGCAIKAGTYTITENGVQVFVDGDEAPMKLLWNNGALEVQNTDETDNALLKKGVRFVQK